MFWKIPDIWIAILNVISWPIIMMTVSFFIIKIDYRRFDPSAFLFKELFFETDGKIYIKLFFIKRWKRLLPDGASWFAGGFAKKNIKGRSTDYFERFLLETCRGELSHWICLCFIPLFFVYNPIWAAIVMSVFGFFINFPCIIVQRYNRIQLRKLILKAKRTEQ